MKCEMCNLEKSNVSFIEDNVYVCDDCNPINKELDRDIMNGKKDFAILKNNSKYNTLICVCNKPIKLGYKIRDSRLIHTGRYHLRCYLKLIEKEIERLNRHKIILRLKELRSIKTKLNKKYGKDMIVEGLDA